MSELFSERVRRLREAKGYGLRFLAQRIGLTHASLVRIENGEHKPRFDSLHPIARALGVSVDYLVSGREAPAYAALQRAIRVDAPRERLLAMVRGSE